MQTKDMTTGSPAGLILRFALPLMLGNVFQQFYTFVDTMVVGQALGVKALAALGAAEWLTFLMFGLVQGLVQGFSLVMARQFGAGDDKGLKKAVAGAVWLSLGAAVLFTALGQLMLRPVLLLLRTPAEIIDLTLIYLRILYASLPVAFAYNLLAALLRALGNSKTPLQAMTLSSFCNIALDLLFVFGFGWGIQGAAAATVLAQLLAACFCFVKLRGSGLFSLGNKEYYPDRDVIKEQLKLGLPMAFQNAIIAVGGMIVQFVVNGFGVLFIAGFTATNKLYGILEVAATSYGYAMVTYVGQNLGAKKIDRISKGMRSALIVAMVTSAVIAAAMLLFGKAILGCFISGAPEDVTATLGIAYHYLAIMSVFLPILYVLHVTRSALQGMGDTILPMASGIAEFIMRTGSAILLPLLLGEEGIFYAEILAWAGADVILVTSYYFRMKKLRAL